MKKIISLILMVVVGCLLTSCYETTDTDQDIKTQKEVASDMAKTQPTPSDIYMTLEYIK